MPWTWNYRIMRSGEGDFRSYYIAEVYSDGDQPQGWTDAISPVGETKDELCADVALMLRALDHPVLIEEELESEIASLIEEPTWRNIDEMIAPSMPVAHPETHTTDTSPAILSAPILSTLIVSPPASALRSTPIPGDIADEDTSEAYRNQHASDITITISREDAEAMADFFTDPSERFLLGRVALTCQAALEGEK